MCRRFVRGLDIFALVYRAKMTRPWSSLGAFLLESACLCNCYPAEYSIPPLDDNAAAHSMDRFIVILFVRANLLIGASHILL